VPDNVVAARSAAGAAAETGNGLGAALTSALLGTIDATGVGATAAAESIGVNDNGESVGAAKLPPSNGAPGEINIGIVPLRRGTEIVPMVWADDDEARRRESAAAKDRFMARVYQRPGKDLRS
jgi:hypothetical protein